MESTLLLSSQRTQHTRVFITSSLFLLLPHKGCTMLPQNSKIYFNSQATTKNNRFRCQFTGSALLAHHTVATFSVARDHTHRRRVRASPALPNRSPMPPPYIIFLIGLRQLAQAMTRREKDGRVRWVVARRSRCPSRPTLE